VPDLAAPGFRAASKLPPEPHSRIGWFSEETALGAILARGALHRGVGLCSVALRAPYRVLTSRRPVDDKSAVIWAWATPGRVAG
jgi:hypothetical protein